MWQAIGTIAEMVNSLGQSFNSYDPYGYNQNETAGYIYAGLSGAIDPGQTWEELWNSDATTGEKLLGTINPIAGQIELYKNTQKKAREARRIAEIGTPVYSQFGDLTFAGRTSGIGAGMKKTMVKGSPTDQRYIPSIDVSQIVNTGFNLAGSLSNSFGGTSNNTNTTNTNGFDASQIGNMGTNVPDQMFAKSGIYIKPENNGGYIKNNDLNVSNTLPNGIYYPVGDRVYNQSYYSERGIYPIRYKVGNDGMNVIAKETSEEYFNNPNNNLIIYPEKNKPAMNKGGIVSMNKIKGPSHANGGVDKVLNGVPVEVEGGETQINLSDGSKAILNKEQMNMLRSGISLDRIISTMPKNNVIAEDGTFVYPLVKQVGGVPTYSYDPLKKSWDVTGGVQQDYAQNIINNAGNEELDMTDRIGITNQKKYNKSIKSNQPTNFFDQYNTSLGISALSNAGLNIGNAIANYQTLKQNQKEKPPESVGQVSYSPIAYKYIQSQPQLRQLERGYNFANRFARQSGSPEMVGSNLANYIAGNEQVVSNTNQQNLQGVTNFAQNNAQGLLQANMANVQGKSKDIDNKLRWDAMMAQIQGQNAQNIYNSMQAGVNLGGQYGQNKLSSDIMRDLYGKISPQMYAELMLKQYS